MCEYPPGLFETVRKVVDDFVAIRVSFTSLEVKCVVRQAVVIETEITQHLVGTACREIFNTKGMPGYEAVPTKDQDGKAEYLVYRPAQLKLVTRKPGIIKRTMARILKFMLRKVER